MMPKLSGQTLCKFLDKYGYTKTRQVGSQMRPSSNFMGKEHSITITDHDPVKIGTLNKILIDIVENLHLEKDQLINDLKIN
jgi:predicted RNA binding protein YcfA (HicA-like mRNA interferase family)